MTAYKLESVKPSTRAEKKLMATFASDDDRKIVHFGASGYSDFTQHRCPARKKLYLIRHSTRENWSDPLTPGALSRWILWNKPTFSESLKDYKKRFRM